MNWDVFITCAVTGASDTTAKSPKVPVTPTQIADAAIEAAKAGAAIVHIHVRDPQSGKAARDPKLYEAVVDRIRASGTDVILNLTVGMGGDLILGPLEKPYPPDAASDIAGVTERLAHVEKLRPEICTLDCGSMNFAAGGDYVMVNTPGMLKEMAARVRALAVKPELEVFDTGQLVLVKEMIKAGLIEDPAMIQLCMGIPYGAPDHPANLLNMVGLLPAGAVFSAFSIGRMQLPYVGLAAVAGGNVRVGLEDNIYLERGVLASNGDLVARAVQLLRAMNVKILSPDDARARLKLKKHV